MRPAVIALAIYLGMGAAISAAATVIIKRQRKAEGSDHWCYWDNVMAVLVVFIWAPFMFGYAIREEINRVRR